MTYKIIFTDIDGTLLNKDRKLSSLTVQVFKQLKEKIPIVLISSRMPQAMEHLQEELGISHQPIICYNGAQIILDGKTVITKEISLEIVEKLISFNHEVDCHISLYNDRDWYVPENDYWAKREKNNTQVTPQVKSAKEILQDWKTTDKGAHKIMCMGEAEKITAIENFLFQNYKDPLHLYRSKPTYLEITNSNVSKLTAVNYLLKNYFQLSLEESIAFGDNYNDLEMLQAAGMGIAVENARPEILKIAKQVTAPNIEDGVAKSLQKLFQLN